MNFRLNTKRNSISKRFTFTTIAVVILIAVGFSLLQGENRFFASTINLNKTVTLQTSKGNITIELFESQVPALTENFYWLAKSGKYNNVPFHRVIDGFMIQAGDFENQDGTGGSGFKTKYLPDEFTEGLTHTRGVVSMANKGPDTNGSQFFIVQEDATFLDGRHSIIGQVIRGMEVVDTIAKAETDLTDRPVEDILIKKATTNR